MIIKLIGMGLVIISSTLIGFGAAECMASRERELRNLADAMDLMLGELCYSMLSVRDIILKITPQVNGLAGSLFDYMCNCIAEGDSASYAWSRAIDVKAAEMSLKKSDADVLKNCAYLLEGYEAEEQKKNFSQLKSRLTHLASEAGESKKKNGKLARMFGVYGGVVVCIIIF